MTKNTIIIYHSTYGSTKRYAQRLAEELSTIAINIEDFDINNIDKYDTIIFWSSIYMWKIKKINFIIKNWNRLQNKKIIVFTTALTMEEAQKNLENNIPLEIREKIFYQSLPWAYDYSKLKLLDKFIMQGMKFFMNIKAKSDPKAKKFVENFYKPLDKTDKKYLKSIISY